MKWIKMATRKPGWPKDNTFLAHRDGRVWVQERHCGYSGSADLYDSGMWAPITHWIPMPRAPKVKPRDREG